MSIPMYACLAHGADIITLDDETVTMDLADEDGTGGNSYTARILSSPFEADETYSKLRRVSQAVYVSGSVDVAITPYRDGAPTGQTIDRSLTPGDNPNVEAPLSSLASAHQVEIELTDFDAAVEIGQSRQWLVPRRSVR